MLPRATDHAPRLEKLLRVAARITALALLACVLVHASPAAAEPQWATDLRAKAERWKTDLRAALGRLEDAARAAGELLSADAKRRLDELLAMLNAHADAIEDILRQRGHELEALAQARANEALQIARALERELAEIAAGARQQLSTDITRLATGSRAALTEALRQAGVMLGEARLVDGRLVAEAKAQAVASARRWTWGLAAAGGVIVIAIGVGLLWPRRRAGESALRRPLVTLGGAVLVLGGAAASWLGATKFLASDDASPVVLALSRCSALDLAVPPGASARAQLVRELARCQLAAPDDTTAAAIAAALARALPPSRGGPP